MDSIDFAGKRVLLASLLPDTGHLNSLFQIAGALEERGAKAYPIAPDEAKNVVGRFAIGAEYLGEVISGQGKVALTNYSQAGELSRLFIRGPLVTRKYIIPLKANGLKKFNELVDNTLKFSPDLVFGDTHLFEEG
jgi:UDP:flavonoid glycosyltransferase YjiC (YdhE family)